MVSPDSETVYVCPLVIKVVGFGQTVVSSEVITVVVMRASLKELVVLDVVFADKDAVASGDDDGAVLCSSLLEFVE